METGELEPRNLRNPGTTKPSTGGLSAEDRKVLENVSRFHEAHSKDDLPGPIIALCAGDKKKLAEPDGKWNATDSIINPSLPGKRLIWAAIGGDYYVVHYERGGSRTRFMCRLQSSQRMTPTPNWFGSPSEVHLKITWHLLRGCETGSWTTASIMCIKRRAWGSRPTKFEFPG